MGASTSSSGLLRRPLGRVAWVLTASMASACVVEQAPEDHGSTEASLVVQPSECGQHDPSFVCPYRLWQHEGGELGALPYCATEDLEPLDALGSPKPQLTQYTRLIIGQHGRGSDGGKYRSTMAWAAWYADQEGLNDYDRTFVISPQFLQHEYVCANGLTDADIEDLFVWDSGDGARDWAWGGSSTPSAGAPASFSRGSFELLEDLLDLVFQRMPNIREVIFAGQSAGGQFVQRYAAVNQYEFPGRTRVRYVPANPYSYLYLTSDRPTYGSPAFDTPAYTSWPDTELCTDLVGQTSCSDYDDYGLGLQNRPAGHYVESLPAADILDQYANRQVTYLVGEMDVTHLEQCGCGTQLQGIHRRARAHAYAQYAVEELGAEDHRVVTVPDFSHGGNIFRQPCGYRALFGYPHLCTRMEEQTLLSGWGDVLAMAHGNVDDDPADETALILRHSESVSTVLVLDDPANGHSLMFAQTTYDSLRQWTDVALGDMNGDGRDELAVSRTTTTGDSWFVYRRYNSGTWATFAKGGAEWPSPRSATSVAFGDVYGSGWASLAVARNTGSGSRWYAYRYAPSGGYASTSLQLIRSGGYDWPSGARVRDLAFGDPDGEGHDQLAVARSSITGARIDVYEVAGAPQQRSIGADWAWGSRVHSIAFADADLDGADELLVGMKIVSGPRWHLLDDGLEGFQPILSGGDAWHGHTVTSVAVARTDVEYMYTLAIGTSALSGSTVHLLSLQEHDDVLQIGDHSERSVPSPGSVGALSFGDVDGLGGADLVYGVKGLPAYSLAIVPAP